MGNSQEDILKLVKEKKVITTKEVSEETGMTPKSAWARLKILKKWGFIGRDRSCRPCIWFYIG